MRVNVCPKCGGESIRIHGRLVDRLHGVFLLARRFRCYNFLCQYEGNVRKSVSPQRMLALASADLLGATLVGIWAIDIDSPFVSYTELLDANVSLEQYWIDNRLSRSSVALLAQP